MGRLLRFASVVWSFWALAACKQHDSTDQKPVWSDLEHQTRAHSHSRPTPSASAATTASAAEARFAAPLAVARLPQACPTTDRVHDLKPDEKVLVSPIRVNFAVAKVVTPERDGKVVVASRHGNEFVAAAEHVYPLRPGHQSRATPNCYGACRVGSDWIPCLVTEVDGSRILAHDKNAQKLSLRATEVVVFDPPVQQQVRDFFAEADYERSFREQVAHAGTLQQTLHPNCHKGELVLAGFGEKYLLARVTEARGPTCTLKWVQSSMAPAVRQAQELVPLPSSTDRSPSVAPGDFVLAPARGKVEPSTPPVSPPSDQTRQKPRRRLWTEWEPMRIEAVYADGRLLLTDAQQKQYPRTSAEVVGYGSSASAR